MLELLDQRVRSAQDLAEMLQLPRSRRDREEPEARAGCNLRHRRTPLLTR